jgi:Zn-dependent protease
MQRSHTTAPSSRVTATTGASFFRERLLISGGVYGPSVFLIQGSNVADREIVFGVRDSQDAHRPSFPVSIGPGGLAPVLLLAALFGTVGAKVGVPVAAAALLGGIGGTASLLVHELGHVRAARRSAGIRSVAVSLIWLGAATRFEGRYETGREQARVAIAGPRASFVLALSLAAACFLPIPLQVKDAVLLLALFNVAIGVMNLVPVYPLDGHKLALGLLWCATGSEKKARRFIRRAGLGWAAVELSSAAFLCVQRPHLGLAVVAMAATLLAQKPLIRKPASELK